MLLTKNDDTCRAVSNLLILSPTELDHGLGGRVGNLNLSEDSIAIVCETDGVRRKEQRKRASVVGRETLWSSGSARGISFFMGVSLEEG